MKMPAILRKKSVADVSTEGDELMKSRAAMEAEIAALDEKRGVLILDAEADDIVAHDQARARLAVRIEQANARLTRLDGEMVAAQTAEDQRKREEVYAKAKKVRGDGVAALAAYQQAATQAAAHLNKLAQVEDEIAKENAMLPEGYDPIPMAEPDNSRPMIPEKFGTAEEVVNTATGVISRPRPAPLLSQHVPGRPHVSVRWRARIPGVKPNETLYDGANAR